MADDLRARLAAAFEPHCWHEFASTGEAVTSIQVADALDAAMATVRPSREGHAPYCEGGHGNAVTCAQVAVWRRDSARDPWRCWHNPHDGRPLHSFADQDVCQHGGCGARLSELHALDARRGPGMSEGGAP